MPHPYLFAYIFTAFVVGVACLGVALVLATRRDDALARGFLPFYAALTVLVLGRLLLSAIDAGAGESVRFPIEYLESFVGRYGVMFTLPFFAHRVFAVESGRRDTILLVVVLARRPRST